MVTQYNFEKKLSDHLPKTKQATSYGFKIYVLTKN